MSQPEKQPEGGPEAAESAESAGAAAPGGRAGPDTSGGPGGPEAPAEPTGGGAPGPGEGAEAGSTGPGPGPEDDLVTEPFPPGGWQQPADRLEALYLRAEQEAARCVGWYLRGRLRKRRAARLLRAGTVLGVAAGLLLPMLEPAGVGALAGWGYPALLAAALCLGADRYFGLTSGWMRDLATAQAVQQRLETLRYDWAAENIREVLGPTQGTTGEAAERGLALLRRFSEDVTELVRTETTDWMIGFRGSGAGPSVLRAALPARLEPEPVAAPPRRPAPPVGTRPSMPRQRPPEGPR